MKHISLVLIKILMIIIIMNLIFLPISEASFWGDIFSEGDEFLKNGEDQTNPDDGSEPIDNAKLKEEVNRLYNILLTLGIVLSVLVGAILGIKYMFGSIEEQVKVKETLFPYLIGCIVVFSAFAIWKIVVNVLSKIS